MVIFLLSIGRQRVDSLKVLANKWCHPEPAEGARTTRAFTLDGMAPQDGEGSQVARHMACAA
jgi:hypothetical protein